MSVYLRCYRDFSGGLSEVANDNMADNQLSRAVNIIPGDGYGISRSFGVSRDLPRLPNTDYNHRLKALIPLTLGDGSTQLLAFTSYPLDCQRMYKLAANGRTWTLLVDEQRPLLDHFIHGHKLYWLDGAYVKRYDGANVINMDITPAGASVTPAEAAVWAKVEKAVAVEQRGQRWFYATADDEVIFSEIGSPSKIDPANIINVNSGNDDHITALKEFCGGLLIFKRYSVHFLSGWDLAGGSDIQLTRLNVSSGTRWPHTIRVVENALVYLGENGVYRLYLPHNSYTVAAENISEGHISGALAADGPLREAYAQVWDNVYFLTVRGSDSGALLKEYRYWPDRRAFFGEYTQQAGSYSLYDGKLYLGLYGGWIAYYNKKSRSYWDTVRGEGASIPIYAATKGFDVANVMTQDVKLRKVIAIARQFKDRSSHATIRIKADYQDGSYTVGLLDMDESMVFGEEEYGAAYWGWQETVTKEMAVNRKTKRVWFYITDDTIYEPLLIYGLGLVYKKRRVKGSRQGVLSTQVQYDD